MFYINQQSKFIYNVRIYLIIIKVWEGYFVPLNSVEMYSTVIDMNESENNRKCKYRYILLEGEKKLEHAGDAVVLPCFGAEIIREDIVDGSVCYIESDRIPCMTTYRYKAAQLVKKLYVNMVSPVHLIDIAGPLADEWVEDFDRQLNKIAVL